MQFFEYLFGILSEILMCEIILLELLGNVGIVEIIEECWSLWHSFASWLYEKKKFVKSV